ncbi:MAG: hypothetical protein IPM75_12360 [Candidatus Competibacteraceae bacterium]|nr:hypothetical protein [Candidatus Competibacteraceae bacterium]
MAVNLQKSDSASAWKKRPVASLNPGQSWIGLGYAKQVQSCAFSACGGARQEAVDLDASPVCCSDAGGNLADTVWFR